MNARLNPTETQILHLVKLHNENDTEFCVTQEKLGRRIYKSPTTVRAAVARLIKLNLITKKKSKHDSKTNIYDYVKNNQQHMGEENHAIIKRQES